jgi:S-adenosylmethionine:tRNA ribosyltransferase-isomerase
MLSVLDKYDYSFPPELIAQRPASPRDAARLLVLDRATGETSEAVFRDLAQHLPPRSVIVMNETKVVPARLTLRKPTGGLVRVLYIASEGAAFRAMADRKLADGDVLTVEGVADGPSFTVSRQDEKHYLFTPSFPMAELFAVLEKYGAAPLPPYIKHTPLSASEVKDEYQAVFAKHEGSVAAPTASLHFTDALLAKLKAEGHDLEYVTLHVNLGTFAPLTEEHLEQGRLHTEAYAISAETAARLNAAKAAGRPIVAVGTTVVRTLETAAAGQPQLSRLAGETSIFIREGYHFAFVSALITNFHVPKSSLLMLVSAFAGRDHVMAAYHRAVESKFRLFSFGDAMLIK